MAISEAFVDTGTSISTTEWSLTNDSSSLATQTDDGIYQLFLDVNALAAGDVFTVKAYEKVYGAATQRVIQTWTLSGAQADPVFVTPPLILIHGWDFSIIKTTGTDRSIAWSVRKVG
jgi:hypothetical protein